MKNDVARRIGILGGTFDPVHIGHLILAICARDQLPTDELILIPNARSPLKSEQPQAPFADRMEMLRLAVGELPGISVSDIEGRRGGISYMVDTLQALHHDYPNDELHLVMGCDAAKDLHSWHQAPRVLELARIAVVARYGEEETVGVSPSAVITMPRVDVSASDIRKRLRRGQPIDFFTPESVVSYIYRHGLYPRS